MVSGDWDNIMTLSNFLHLFVVVQIVPLVNVLLFVASALNDHSLELGQSRKLASSVYVITIGNDTRRLQTGRGSN